jgi:hypothetical protein
MSTLLKTAILLVIAAVIMFLIGGSLFTYQGPAVSRIVSKIGEYSFVLWLPTFGLSILFMVASALEAIIQDERRKRGK